MRGEGEASSSGRLVVAAAALLALLASLPSLFTRGMIADDWVVHHILWGGDFGAIVQLLYDVAHLGYIVPYAPFLLIAPDMPNFAVRVITLVAHLANGWLLWRALGRSDIARPVAGLTAALYLLSPFYAVRLTLNGAYDVLMLFYLGSLNLMHARSRFARALGPVAQFLSFGLEALIALEPLRALLAWRGDGWRAWLLRLVPYGVVVLLVIALRLTILGKHGHYAGQYSIISDPDAILEALRHHLWSFVHGIGYVGEHALSLMPSPYWLGLGAVLVVMTVIFGARFAPPATPLSLSGLLGAAALSLAGVLVAVLGALPYALVGINAWATRAETRHGFASQVGVLLLVAVVLSLIPWPRLRTAAVALAVVFCAASTLHDTKWLLYDGAVTTDLQRQLRAALAGEPGALLVEVRLQPTSNELFFRNRCIGAQDLNVGREALRAEGDEPRSFSYEENCGDFTNPGIVPAGRCPISYLDGFPCPERREVWHYLLERGRSHVSMLSLWDLVRDSLDPARARPYGHLIGPQGPLPVADTPKIPCEKPGAKAAAWVLGYPDGFCP